MGAWGLAFWTQKNLGVLLRCAKFNLDYWMARGGFGWSLFFKMKRAFVEIKSGKLRKRDRQGSLPEKEVNFCFWGGKMERHLISWRPTERSHWQRWREERVAVVSLPDENYRLLMSQFNKIQSNFNELILREKPEREGKIEKGDKKKNSRWGTG